MKEKLKAIFEKLTRRQWAAAAVVLCFVLAGLVFALNGQRDSAAEHVPGTVPTQQLPSAATESNEPVDETQLVQSVPTENTTAQTEPEEETASEDTAPEETDEPVDSQTEPEETEPEQPQPTDPKPTEPLPTQPQYTEPVEQIPTETQPEVEFTEPTDPEPTITVIELPYEIEGTTLKVLRVAPYVGMYMEDGSNEEVSDIAMMLVENIGEEAVEYGKITMEYEGQTVSFVVTALPAGGKAIVQAADRSSCPEGDIHGCWAEVAYLPQLEMSESEVAVIDNGDNSLTVENLTDETIPVVRVFYKYYMEEEDIFVGGITFTAKITDLAAGEYITVSPSHFASGSGKVVMVRTYDSDQE